MNKILFPSKVNAQGFVPIIVLVAVIGLVAFVLVSGTASFKSSSKNASLYGDRNTFAKSPYQVGDANGDNQVNILDYNLIITNFSKVFENGDFNGDGKVDILDYNLLISNFGKKYTAQNTPTPAASAALTMINGVPVCTDHDPTIWHPLVKKDAQGNIICTYGHHHGDDPMLVDDIFGTVGTWWGAPGHAIGYPWLTSPAENTQKHNLFKNIVRKNLTPAMSQDVNGVRGQGNYVKAFRAWTHLLGSGGDIPGYPAKDGFQAQVHSFAVEAQICSLDNNCGIIKIGGYQDIGYGVLLFPNQTGEGSCVIPNAGMPGDCSTQTAIAGPRHIHGAVGSGRYDFTWYADTSPSYRKKTTANTLGNIDVNFGTIGKAWAQVDPTDYNKTPFINPDTFTDNWVSQEILGFNFNSSFLSKVQAVSNGRVNFKGFTDNWGNVYQTIAACQADASPVCVPLEITNIPVGFEIYRDSYYQFATGTNPTKDHDEYVTVGGKKKSLTIYPN